MNWSEKYRPNTIDDLYLSYDSKNKIKQWINNFIKKKTELYKLFNITWTTWCW